MNYPRLGIIKREMSDSSFVYDVHYCDSATATPINFEMDSEASAIDLMLMIENHVTAIS